jgi:pimeloyl-ACP methyl ester carboxylesterase
VAEGRTPTVPYVLADMADDAVAVLDDLGIDRAHVMGLSMGGMIVQQLAIAHPERLRSLTSVMSTTGDPDVGQAHRDARALLFGPPATTREEAIARAVQGLHVWGSPEHLDDERTASIAAEAYDRAFDPAGQARQLMGILASPSRTDALRGVEVPALVLHGDRDRLVDISGGRRTAEAIPGATFVVMEGMGHDYPPAYWDRWVGSSPTTRAPPTAPGRTPDHMPRRVGRCAPIAARGARGRGRRGGRRARRRARPSPPTAAGTSTTA